MRLKIVFVIIILSLTLLEIVNPIFRPILKYMFQKTLIPYDDKSGLPTNESIYKTINFLKETKQLRLFLIRNKFYLQKAEKENGYYEKFNRSLNEELYLKFDKFMYDVKLKNGYTYRKSYLSSIYLSKYPKEYMLFEFSYPNDSQKGLILHYKLFFNNRKEIEWKNEDYQSVIKLEKNWYLLIYTTIDLDSEQWNNVKSTNTKYIWDGIPPLEYIIKPYQHKEIANLLNVI